MSSLKKLLAILILLALSSSPASAQNRCCKIPFVPYLDTNGNIVCGTAGAGLLPVTTGSPGCDQNQGYTCNVATNTCESSQGFTPSAVQNLSQFTCNNFQGVDTALGCLPTDPQQFVQAFFPWALGLAGLAALLLLAFGALSHITAAGNPEQIQKAKEVITSAIAGLVIIIFSVVLLRIIGADILGLPGIEGKTPTKLN